MSVGGATLSPFFPKEPAGGSSERLTEVVAGPPLAPGFGAGAGAAARIPATGWPAAAPSILGRETSAPSSTWKVPSRRSAQDVYGDVEGDKKAILAEVRRQFPMLCHCSSEGEQKPCRFTQDGHRGRLPTRARALWAWPIFGWYALKYMKVGWMKKFYMDDYPQANLGIIAFAGVLSILIDAFTDPGMAALTDNLRSKYGRRRPFMVISAAVVPVTFFLSWTPFVSPGFSASLWYGFFHIMCKLCETVFEIPHMAWGAQLTPLYQDKTLVWQSKEIASNMGVLFGLAGLPVLFVDDNCSSTPNTGCVQLPAICASTGILFCCGCLLLGWKGKEPVFTEKASRTNFSATDTVPVLISTWLNRPFRSVLLLTAAKAFGVDLPFIVLPFMTSWVLGEKCMNATFGFQALVMVHMVCGLAAVPFWTWLARRKSKYIGNVLFNGLLGMIFLAMMSLGYDDGDCGMTKLTFGMVVVFGLVFGGTFLINDLVNDIIDYDQLLTGGKRREASYYMAVEFMPKFMTIPSESLPFLLMAYYKYARPLPDDLRPACGAAFISNVTSLAPDAFCEAFFASASANEAMCSSSASCQDLINNGVTFVCNFAKGSHGGECGIKQNESVRWVLLLSFSLVPALCLAGAVVGLLFYPMSARGEESQERLLQAIAKLQAGAVVEDPWRPGNFVHPEEPPGPHAGALSYFFPSELRQLALAVRADDDSLPADCSRLWHRPCAWAFGAGCGVLLPVGMAVVLAGLKDLSDDLGASVSPLGMMILGLGLVIVWFQGSRFLAAIHLRRVEVPRQEVIAAYNSSCSFVGAQRLSSSSYGGRN